MTKNEAIQFLSNHQPMPSDDLITQELIDKYDEVRRFFIQQPDDEAVMLFLRSYGEWDGWGVYQLVEDFFYACDAEKVKTALKEVLEDEKVSEGVRYWNTQLAAVFSDEKLRAGVNISMKSKNENIRDAALVALDMI